LLLAGKTYKTVLCNLLQYAVEPFSLADNVQQLRQDQFGVAKMQRPTMHVLYDPAMAVTSTVRVSQEVPSLLTPVLDVGRLIGHKTRASSYRKVENALYCIK